MTLATEELVVQKADTRARSVARLARRHAVFLGVLAVAVGLRVAVLLAYPDAFWFPDSSGYAAGALTLRPDQIHPPGYSAFLRPFVPGPMITVAVLQHVIGVGLVVLGYAFLVRRAVPPWLSALAVLPVAADDLQLTMEHFISSDTLFTALFCAGLLVLTWRRRTPVGAAAVAGLLLALAVLTRLTGLPLIALALLYLVVKLVVRQTNWLAVLAFVVAAAIPLGGYLVWFHSAYGVYTFNQVGGRALYSRVMSIADCDRLRLTDQQRLLCVPEPPAQRPEAPDYWGWNADSPGNKYFASYDNDPFLRQFGLSVITQQTGDYVLLVLRETGWHFLPRAPLSADTWCRFGGWRLPERPNTSCNAAYFTPPRTFSEWPQFVPQPSTPLRSALSDYSTGMSRARGPLMAFGLLIVLGSVLWRPRSGERRHSVDALLIAAAGFGLLIGSVALGMYEPRYAVTAVFLIPIAAALALRRHLRGPTGRTAQDGLHPVDGIGQP